jgi:uncharacterized membrane protein YdbT with pleckstrin-like domain
MRFESSRSGRMSVLMYGMCAVIAVLAVLYCVFFESPLKYLIALMCLMVVALVIWVRCATWYELREESLYLRSGPFHDEIPYGEIRTVDKTRGIDFIMALDYNRLQINAGLNPEKGKIVLSPEREDEFLAELGRRCPELEIRG